jgi:hypothetical protein
MGKKRKIQRLDWPIWILAGKLINGEIGFFSERECFDFRK